MDESFEEEICKHFASTYAQIHKDLLMTNDKTLTNESAWAEIINKLKDENYMA